jgi:hypothetical protein
MTLAALELSGAPVREPVHAGATGNIPDRNPALWPLSQGAAADSLFPACQRRGVQVLAAGVFNSGILADPRPGAAYDYTPAPPPA